jgi:hypothetical protein
VSHVRLECTQEIIPVLVAYDKHSALDLALDAVKDEAAVQWLDDRIIAFVKAYLAVIDQDADLREHLKDQLVEHFVTKIRFPKYPAASTRDRDGKTYYFLDQDTRRQFDQDLPAKS